jgi:hypothetical protein
MHRHVKVAGRGERFAIPCRETFLKHEAGGGAPSVVEIERGPACIERIADDESTTSNDVGGTATDGWFTEIVG